MDGESKGVGMECESYNIRRKKIEKEEARSKREGWGFFILTMTVIQVETTTGEKRYT